MNKGVFVIYTGGTVGSMPRDELDDNSPQVVVPWEKLLALTPELSEKKLGFRLGQYSMKPPLDSCNIGPSHWIEMARVIRDNYEDYEGFVILHGTDTMAYTASALSFMLLNLQKPVIITGSVRSGLFQIRNDAVQNIVTSLQIANPAHTGIPVVPEVCIFFQDKLFRGNRVIKLNASGYSSYATPNYPLLGTAGEQIVIDTHAILKLPQRHRRFTIRQRLETNVIIFDVFPGIQDGRVAQRLLLDRDLKGVIIKSYGAGNIPTDKRLIEVLKQATKAGVVIQTVTQCVHGRIDLGLYETGIKLMDAGVITGQDMTPETALCKLMVLLGDSDLDPELNEVAAFAQQNLCGEQELDIFVTKLSTPDNLHILDSCVSKFRTTTTDIKGYWTADNVAVEKAYLRLWSCTIEHSSTNKVSFNIWINLDIDSGLDKELPEYMGKCDRQTITEPTLVDFDITEAIRLSLDSRSGCGRVSFTVALDNEDGSVSWGSTDVVLFMRKE